MLVGQLPEPLQKITVYTAAATPKVRNPEALQGFLVYLRSPEGRGIFARKGFLAP